MRRNSDSKINKDLASATSTPTSISATSASSTSLELQSESVLNSPPKNNIHEGQISYTHGFVPFQPISATLPAQYKAWEELATHLPRYISEGSEREHIRALPLLDADDRVHLPNEHLSRSIAIIGNFAHVYYYNQRLGQDQASDPLPRSVLIPWQQLTKRVQRKLPPDANESVQAVRIHYDTFLTNWQLNNPRVTIDGTHNHEITLQDISILSPIFGNAAESNFNMTFVVMELRFAPALQHITDAIKAVANGDEAALIAALQGITTSIEYVTDGLDYINPNPHSQNHVDPTVWTKTVAKIDGKIPGGVSGLSGSAMPLFHVLDTFLERVNYKTTMGQAMVTKYKHQPAHIVNYLSSLRQDLAEYSIRDFVSHSSNRILKSQYDLLMKAYLGEQGLMGVHAVKVYGYMKINFRNGRLLTNGGHDGTSTIATEPQRHIYDDFAQADVERVGGYVPTPHYATKITMRTYSNHAATVILDVSNTALKFLPGDHCSIQPQNSRGSVERVILDKELNPILTLKLNAAWKAFFQRHYSTVNEIETIELVDLMFHIDLDTLPSQGSSISIDDLKPLTPRYYSVSPVGSLPGHIQLTVGVHKDTEGNPIGLCSSYLLSDEVKFAIDRVPARHFHLPKSKETPILMFAAGTGISPFMGFISERAQYSGKDDNYLFFSTPELDTFYHQEDLVEAVTKEQLSLSVIFTRGKGYDSFEMSPMGGHVTSQYKGRHIDAVIKHRAEEIAHLIVDRKAQIYVCGNSGFADTVRAAIISALSQYSDLSNPSEYIDTLIADFRFNNEVYSSPSPSQQYQSIFTSQVATHNKPNDCWGIINGSVYDLTRFIHVHPGGQKIVLVNGGMDMSTDYNYIKHNQRPEIEGQLQQYKIGVVATPVIKNDTTIKLHDKSKKLVEALTEMENTLRNNTKNSEQEGVTYLWREVYGVFVNGSLASYSKVGAGNTGSLSYVLGPLLQEVCSTAQYPELAQLKELTDQLMTHASECANYIRQSTIGHLSTEELQFKKRIFDSVLENTFKFIDELKGLSLDVLRDIEQNTDDYKKERVSDKLTLMVQNIRAHSHLIGHIVKNLPKLDQEFPALPEAGFVCVFAQQMQGGANPHGAASAISKFGLMPAPQKPSDKKEKSWASSVPCTIL